MTLGAYDEKLFQSSSTSLEHIKRWLGGDVSKLSLPSRPRLLDIDKVVVGVPTIAFAGPFHVYDATKNDVARFESGDAKVAILLDDSTSNNYVGLQNDAGVFSVTDTGVDVLVIDGNGHVGVGTSALPTGGGKPVLALSVASGDPTSLGANAAGIFVKDISSSGELHAFDEAGNVSLLSPHDPQTGEWIFSSHNFYSGKTLHIAMEKLAKAVELLTDQTFVTEGLLPNSEIQDWDVNQQRLVKQRDAEIRAYDFLSAEDRAEQPGINRPEVYVAKSKPLFLS